MLTIQCLKGQNNKIIMTKRFFIISRMKNEKENKIFTLTIDG